MSIFYRRLLAIGIAFGVFSSLFVFTAGQARTASLRTMNEILDSNILKLIYTSESNIIYSISLNEAKQIQELLGNHYLSDYEATSVSGTVSYNGEPLPGSLLGTGINYNSLMGFELLEGRYFTLDELEKGKKVCVLKSSFYELIKNSNPTHIDINNVAYEIIGVFTEANTNTQEINRDICVPITTFYKSIENTDYNSRIVNQMIIDKGNSSGEEILKQITDKLKTDSLPVEGLQIMPYQYDVFTNVAALKEALKILTIMFLASLSVLIIATFNIIHIATASIFDREREFGLKAAIGATPNQIIHQVIHEILVCSLKGGLLGITMACIYNNIFNYRYGRLVLTFDLYSILAGILLTTIAGLLASILPARRAIQIDPIAALREE